MTYRAPSIRSVVENLQKADQYTKTEHRTVKYLNNFIEHAHRPMKRRNKFYHGLRTTLATIKGIEPIRGIYKKSQKVGSPFDFSV